MRTAWLLSLMFTSLALAQEVKEPTPEGTIYKLRVKPALPPLPSLKYELIPASIDQHSTNAALIYHRALLLAGEVRSRDAKYQKLQTEVYEAFEKPIADIHKDKLREYVQWHASSLRELEAAAKCGPCDWGLAQRLQDEGIGVLLPEVQQLRELAYALRARTRWHIAEGKYENALRDIQIGITMGHHVGQGQTFIQFLVGLAICSIFCNELDQVMQLDECPNLYWSLTALPRPLVDIRKPVEGEMRTLEKTIVFPKEIDKGPMTNEQATAALEKLFKVLTNLNEEMQIQKSPLQSPSMSRLFFAGYVSVQYPKAKQNLLRAGKTDIELDAMPAAQVVLLDSMIRCRNARDEYFVWMGLPYPEAIEGMTKARQRFEDLRKNPIAIPEQLMVMLLPSVDRLFDAEIRLSRRIASMRTVEAVRWHAANNGSLPAKLSEITAVTVPLDPLTHQPFDYAVSGQTFTITVPPPAKQMANRGNSWKYIVTLTK